MCPPNEMRLIGMIGESFSECCFMDYFLDLTAKSYQTDNESQAVNVFKKNHYLLERYFFLN
jgi:hypothetical protein